MSTSKNSVEDRVLAIFRELAGDRASQTFGGLSNPKARSPITDALRPNFDEKTADEIAFHLTDWNSDAAFIVAMLLFPERFTPEEIREGVEYFLIHAPNHVAAAAKLAGWPIEDIFEVGALGGNDNEGSS